MISTICFLWYQTSMLSISGSFPNVKHSAIQHITTSISSSVSIPATFSISASISSSSSSIFYIAEASSIMCKTQFDISWSINSQEKIIQVLKLKVLTVFISRLFVKQEYLIVQNFDAHEHSPLSVGATTHVLFLSSLPVESCLVLGVLPLFDEWHQNKVMVEILLKVLLQL